MSLRRQCYEWRNIVESAGDRVYLNGYPVNWVGNVDTMGFPANKPVDIFVGGIGNKTPMVSPLDKVELVDLLHLILKGRVL